MQHGKCCYSEIKIPEDGHGKAVEHFHPQSVFKWLRNDWGNLLLVCPQCNGKKRDKFPTLLTERNEEAKVVYLGAADGGIPAIIDPSSVDPEEHLTYVLDDTDTLFGQIVPLKDSVLGRETIEATGIAESYFMRERRTHLMEVLTTTYYDILRALDNQNDEAREAAIARFQTYLDETSKFAGLAREFARNRRMQRFGLVIRGRTP